MTTEDEIRRVLHPEAHERLGDVVRPVGPGRLPLGCDQQGRYPQAAEPCIDLDELGVREPPPPEPLWPKFVGIIVAIIVIVAVFAPVGGGK